MIKTQNVRSSLTCLLFAMIALVSGNSMAWHQPMSIESIRSDVEVLASDKMNGRKTFTPGIDRAADYIASRFAEAGLQPLSGPGFLQKFSLISVTPDKTRITLNSKPLEAEKIMPLVAKNIHWSQKKPVRVESISADQNFRQRLFMLNKIKENLIILIDPAHAQSFARARDYFAEGRIIKDKSKAFSAVAILSAEKSLSQYDIDVTTNQQSLPLANVVGVLKADQPHANAKSRKRIIFSSHYDHLGGRPSETSDRIFNGADDDASGTTAVMQLAEYFAKMKHRSLDIIFVAFTAEEMGGFGSQYFSTHIDPDTIVAMINIEMIGKPSKFGQGQVWMTGFDKSNLGHLLNQSLEGKGFEIHPDPYPAQRLFYRSDNATLARLGVPAHSFSSTQIDKDEHYHQVSDEVKTLNIESMQGVIRSLAIATQPLVEGKIEPTRIEPLPVRAEGSFF